MQLFRILQTRLRCGMWDEYRECGTLRQSYQYKFSTLSQGPNVLNPSSHMSRWVHLRACGWELLIVHWVKFLMTRQRTINPFIHGPPLHLVSIRSRQTLGHRLTKGHSAVIRLHSKPTDDMDNKWLHSVLKLLLKDGPRYGDRRFWRLGGHLWSSQQTPCYLLFQQQYSPL